MDYFRFSFLISFANTLFIALQNDIERLVKAGVIDEPTAERIRSYYSPTTKGGANRQFVIFGILGAILSGLGIILIIAHNWDSLSTVIKTVFAFLPLLLGQSIVGFVLIKRWNNASWRESAGAFLFFSIGACLAMVSQIYHISGTLPSFVLTWMLLALPIVYVLNTSIVTMLCILGITFYAVNSGYMFMGRTIPWNYWGYLALLMPKYILEIKKNPGSNISGFYHWLIGLSVIICLGAFSGSRSEFMFIAYMSLFAVMFHLGNLPAIRASHPSNGFIFLSVAGTLVILFCASFRWFWDDFFYSGYIDKSPFQLRSWWLGAGFSAAALVLTLIRFLRSGFNNPSPFFYIWLIFLLIFVPAAFSPFAPLLVNILILFLGLYFIRDGNRKNHLGLLNFGLLIIALLVALRFFDTELSFVVRGLMFIAVGVGFFLANYYLLKKGKAIEAS